jgi:hypothetical protein
MDKWKAIMWIGIFASMGSCTAIRSYCVSQETKKAMDKGYIEAPNPHGDRGDTIWVKP